MKIFEILVPIRNFDDAVHPTIAQLAERETVEALAVISRSLVRIRLVGNIFLFVYR